MADDLDLVVNLSIPGFEKILSNFDMFSQKMSKLPTSKVIDDLSLVNKKLEELNASLASLPADSKVKIEVQNLADFGKALEKEVSKVKAPVALNELGKELQRVFQQLQGPKPKFLDIDTSKLKELGAILESMGQKAAISFGVGSLAVSKFVKAADPFGVMLFQGTLAQISVQLGSIFLPILDSVSVAMQRLLEWLRGLSNGTKDTIAQWVMWGGILLGALAVIPPLIKGFQLVSLAIRGIGVAIGFASGGLVPLIGTLVGASVAFGLFSEASKDAGGGIAGVFSGLATIFKGLMELLHPIFVLIGGLANVIGTLLVGAFEALKTPLMWVVDFLGFAVKVIASAVAGIVGFIGILANFLTGNWKKLNFDDTKKMIKDIWSGGGDEGIGALRHSPTATGKVDVIGITELWRRAQMATMETPEQKAANERARLQQGTNDKLDDANKTLGEIANNTAGRGGVAVGR